MSITTKDVKRNNFAWEKFNKIAKNYIFRPLTSFLPPPPPPDKGLLFWEKGPAM
jgi:hypothetical protein